MYLLKTLTKTILTLAIFCLLSSCILIPRTSDDIRAARWDADYLDWYEKPSNPQLTPEATALFNNLLELRGKGMLFGHNESTQRGLGDWSLPEGVSDLKELSANEELSDVKMVCGDYPALVGWDMPYDDEFMGHYMKTVYERGGINLIGWHPNNFANKSGGDSWTTSADLSLILPGGELHNTFISELDKRAELFNSITFDREGDGTVEKVPFIFKLYHEHNGVWFWWGRASNSAKEFKALWKMTVDRFREQGVHQMLVAYAPDVFGSPVDFLERYPGSDYVDIIGHDNYHFFRNADSPLARAAVRDVSLIGRAFGKPVGLTEMGQYVSGGITDADFWTQNILKPLTASEVHKEITFALFWRNQNSEHYFAPYPGHESAADFVQFYNDSHMWFQKEATAFGLYK